MTAAGGVTLLGCAGNVPQVRSIEAAYNPNSDQARQIQDVKACYRQIADMVGFNYQHRTTIISRAPIQEQNGVVGTFRINKYDGRTLDFTVQSAQEFTKGGSCHEVGHVIQHVRRYHRNVAPLLTTSVYMEAEAQMFAQMTTPEFEKEFLQLKAVGANMIATPSTAIPDFDNFKPGYEFTADENTAFKIGGQVLLMKMGMLNYADFLNNAFTDPQAGFASIQKQIFAHPDKVIEIMRDAGEYTSDEEFYQNHPFFGPIIPGPRVFTIYDDAGYLYVYYFTVLSDGSIQPLEGIATYKTMDGKFQTNMKVKGIGYVKLNDAFKTHLRVRIDGEGVLGSLTDYITIPK